MDYAQFMKQLNEQEYAGKESVQLLQEYIKEFPYFQTAQSMLTRAMFEQQHVRFEKQLKLTSAYAGDRKILYNTIHPRPANFFSEKAIQNIPSFVKDIFSEKENAENVFAEENPLLPPVESEKLEREETTEYHFTPVLPVYTEEIEITDTEADIDDGPMVADPHEIIRKRLSEILGLKENNIEFKPLKADSPTEEKQEIATAFIEDKKIEVIADLKTKETSEIFTPPFPSKDPSEIQKENLKKILEESVLAKDVIDKGELEHALAATLIHSLQELPVIEKEPIREKIISQKKRDLTFYDWLKQTPVNDYGKFEEVHAYETDVISE